MHARELAQLDDVLVGERQHLGDPRAVLRLADPRLLRERHRRHADHVANELVARVAANAHLAGIDAEPEDVGREQGLERCARAAGDRLVLHGEQRLERGGRIAGIGRDDRGRVDRRHDCDGGLRGATRLAGTSGRRRVGVLARHREHHRSHAAADDE
jgi:hypothetical protein